MSDNQIKYTTRTGLKNSFQSFLDRLKDWLPIKKNKNSVIITTPEYQNAVEIKSNGMIYIVGTNNDSVSLQERINKGTEVVDTYLDASAYLENPDNLGKLIYVLNDFDKDGDQIVDYSAGLYVILKDIVSLQHHLVKLGTTTSSEKDLGVRVDALEHFVENPIEIKDNIFN